MFANASPPASARATLQIVAMAAALWAATSLAAPSPAAAVDFEVSSDTVVQTFALRTGYRAGAGPGDLEYRTRFTEMLRLSAYNITGEAGLYLVASLRYDVDFGLLDECGGGGIVNPSPRDDGFDPDGRPIDPHLRLLCGSALDVRQLYVGWNRLAGGWLDFKVGRQWKVDPLGWFAFDGAMVRVRTPLFFGVEVAGGIETTNGLLLGRTPFERDGDAVRVAGSPSGRLDGDPAAGTRDTLLLDHALRPSPFLQVGVFSRGFGVSHATLVYRRVWGAGLPSLDAVSANRDVGFGGAVEEERIGWALSYGLTKAIRARASLVADLMWPRIDEVTAEVAYRDPKGVFGVRGGVQYLRPRFSASSIFYFYDFRPTSDLFVRAEVNPSATSTLYVRAALRAYGIDWASGENIDFGAETYDLAPAVDIGGRLKIGRAGFGFAVQSAFGRGGTDVGGSLTLEVPVVRDELSLFADGSLYVYSNALQPSQRGLFGSVAAGIDYRISKGARLRVRLEDHVSPFFISNFRAYGLLNLDFWL